MCGNSHYSARTVAHHNVIGNKDRDFFTVYGIDRRKAFKAYACLVLNKLSSLKFRFFSAFRPVCRYIVKIQDHIPVFIEHRMFGSHYHKRYAEKSIGTRCINTKLFIGVFDFEINKCTC